MNRCKFFDMMENRGIQKGEDKLNNLYQKLLADDRMDDLRKAIEDVKYRNQLLKQYGM